MAQRISLAAIVLALVWPIQTPAQTPAAQSNVTYGNARNAANASQRGNILQEIIVTSARKRLENVQTTPIAVTAINKRALEQAHVTNYAQLGELAPNLYLTKTVSNFDTVDVYLRGFGAQTADPSVDPHVALFLDGIYQPALQGTLIDTFDVEQVEVLGGPQGTLFGKNAPIGAVSIRSRKPTGDFSGEIEGDYGSYDHIGARALVNFPLVRNEDGTSILAGKVSFVEKEGGNWYKDTLTNRMDQGGENDKAMRLSLAFTPSTEFEWDLTAALGFNRDPQPAMRPADFYPAIPGTSSSAAQPSAALCAVFGPSFCGPSTYGQNASDFTQRNRADTAEVASTINYHFEPVTLTSVTGFIDYWSDTNSNHSETPTTALDALDDREIFDEESEELRISSNKGGGLDLDGLLDWVLGGYYSNYHFDASENFDIFGPPHTAILAQRQVGLNTSEAVFAHLIFNFTDQWTGTFAVRQSWDQKQHSYQPPGVTQFSYDVPVGFHNTSFEAGTAYQFDKDHMAYFRFSQGYESGGYVGFPACSGCGSSFQPETNNAYEVGFKSDWLNKRLRVNADLFVNQLSDLQVQSTVVVPFGTGFLQQTVNAGAATVEGVEAQVVAVPVENLTTHLTLGYLHTRYNKYMSTVCSNNNLPADCSGVPFEFAPKWTMDLGGDYAMDLPQNLGTADFSLDWNYKSSLYTAAPPFPFSYQGGYGLVNAGLKLTDASGAYSLEFYGTNILDRHYKTNVTDPGLDLNIYDGRPAEWGMRLTYKFGPT